MTARKALKAVKRGEQVFVGTACAKPRALLATLLDRADALHEVQILHCVTLGHAEYTDSRFDCRFRHNAFFVDATTREAVREAWADYTPVFMHQIPVLFRSQERSYHLDDRRDLALHTEVVSDAIIPLIEQGVIADARKTFLPGRIVCSFCIGSWRMYDYVDGNLSFLFLPSDQAYNPLEIVKN